MTYIMVDVEADGPIPGDYSMVSFGAIVVEPSLDRTFYGRLKPISDKCIAETLQVSGFSREATLGFDQPATVMQQFADWIRSVTHGQPMFISDNNGFDWQFINWYFHHFLGRNPFGHSSTNLGSLYKSVVRDMFVNFKHLRKTAHTHHPVDDVRGNAEALLQIKEQFGLKIRELLREEAMAGYMMAYLNHFVLGRGNFLADGDAAGFIHGAEGISAALVSGDLAAQAILQANETGSEALGPYRRCVGPQVNRCLDQLNPLRMSKNAPMVIDGKAFRDKLSLKTILLMYKDLKAFVAQDIGLKESGMGKVLKQNMIHHLLHRRYPIEL